MTSFPRLPVPASLHVNNLDEAAEYPNVQTNQCVNEILYGMFLNSSRNSKTGWKGKKKKAKWMTFRVDLEKKGETVSKISFSLKIHLSKNLVNYTLEDITIDIITRNIFSGVHLKIPRSMRFASREYVIMIGINFPFLRGGSSLAPHRSQWRRFVPRGCDSSTFMSSNLILVTFQMHFERM